MGAQNPTTKDTSQDGGGRMMSMIPDQVSLALTRGVKFNRHPQGWTAENVDSLLQESKEMVARLSSCNRVVRALLPIK